MFNIRVKDLQKKLVDEELDAVLISSVSNINYLTGFSNFSKDEREAYIFIGKNFQYIITDARYSQAVKKEVPHLKLFKRGQGRSTEELFKKHKNEIKNLGVEEDSLTVSEYKVLKEHFKKMKHFNLYRNIKTDDEVTKIIKACKIGDAAFKFILKKIKKGITEKKLAFEIEHFIKMNGEELSFPTIVAFGKNSSVPHHHTGNSKLENNQFVLLDFGVKYENYCSDMTRTIFFGYPSKKEKNIYETVLMAQQKAVEIVNKTIKEGKPVRAENVDKAAREYIISKGYPSIPHSVGHGVGLDVHESPHISQKSEDLLIEGMIFSIEPGIYVEGYGGVRIEDLYVIEKNQVRPVTRSLKSLITV